MQSTFLGVGTRKIIPTSEREAMFGWVRGALFGLPLQYQRPTSNGLSLPGCEDCYHCDLPKRAVT